MSAIKELIIMCRQKEGYLFRSEMEKVNAADIELSQLKAEREALRLAARGVLSSARVGDSDGETITVELTELAKLEAALAEKGTQ